MHETNTKTRADKGLYASQTLYIYHYFILLSSMKCDFFFRFEMKDLDYLPGHGWMGLCFVFLQCYQTFFKR